MGFNEAKKRAIECLIAGNYGSEARGDIDDKNYLITGQLSCEELITILKRCRGNEHSQSRHHASSSIDVHVIVSSDWYIKFYFHPELMFISVHPVNSF